MSAKSLLLTGATGFVGRYLYPALAAAGYSVRCATRAPDEARARLPGREWVAMDVEDPGSVSAAMQGCDAAFFLMHGMGQGGDYAERERRSAHNFARAAERAGLERIVYLGGVLPTGADVSKHLRSRRDTGAVLRAGEVPAIELRAAMIIGVGSVSWTMVRDLSARLPAMLLPRWLRNSSYPVFVDDVVRGLLAALTLPAEASAWFELPGPERITHRRILERTAEALHRKSVMVGVPVLTPRLSSYWIALVTRVDLDLARELVEGLRWDLEPTGESLWRVAGLEPTALGDAIALALGDEGRDYPSVDALARLTAIGRAHAGDTAGRARGEPRAGRDAADPRHAR